jgi:hypothetical protein
MVELENGQLPVPTRAGRPTKFNDATLDRLCAALADAVKEGGRFDREGSSYIDFDEIESLVKGIEYISGLTAEVTKLGGFQAEYRTRGDLAALTYSSGGSGKEIQAAVKSGRFGAATAYVTRNDLTRFREFLRAAQARLQSLKGS